MESLYSKYLLRWKTYLLHWKTLLHCHQTIWIAVSNTWHKISNPFWLGIFQFKYLIDGNCVHMVQIATSFHGQCWTNFHSIRIQNERKLCSKKLRYERVHIYQISDKKVIAVSLRTESKQLIKLNFVRRVRKRFI